MRVGGPHYFAYPAFIANGYLDVSYPDHLDSTAPEDGLWQDGYDWHRWPGTTAVYVPYNQILTSPGQVKDEGGEYPFSDQGFVGGVETVDGNSVFAFPFKGHDMYELESFTGKKSYFFFDNMVVCLGTNITSGIKDYQVETTILQNKITKEGKLLTSNGEINKFPYSQTIEKTKPLWMLDHRGTGYFIPEVPAGAKLKIQSETQTNPQYQNKGSLKGDFSTVLFDHGKASQNVSYNYAVVFNTNQKDMETFTSEMNSKNQPYKILSETEKAHIVKSSKNATTAYAIYDESAVLKKGG
ncbi:polysaccharide lyase family 8 super-sandwich domain-containing protein [Algibacter lectus]|uniref:polysaccharide lyase family 8 super-sandwich domain-containing protein n=1 Tax=Algibacter lectus TaxID=221126 RepID=UPI00187C82A5|nr:polysaccharide lyase family 8 super-sandwich domain-containing protein [Algibacter lectus]